jgi:hypothetical protein
MKEGRIELAPKVLPDRQPPTIEPTKQEESVVPKFLLEITASGTQITIAFRAGSLIPADLRILMPIPQAAGGDRYWLVWPTDQFKKGTDEVTVELATCTVCDAKLQPIAQNMRLHECHTCLWKFIGKTTNRFFQCDLTTKHHCHCC